MFQDNRLCIANAIERCKDHIQHALDISAYIVVPKTQHAIALTFEPTRSHGISFGVRRKTVLRAIDFDNEMRGHTGKVDDIVSDWHLPAEVSAARL